MYFKSISSRVPTRVMRVRDQKSDTYDPIQLGQSFWVVLSVQQLYNLVRVQFHAWSLLQFTQRVYRRNFLQKLLHRDDVVFSIMRLNKQMANQRSKIYLVKVLILGFLKSPSMSSRSISSWSWIRSIFNEEMKWISSFDKLTNVRFLGAVGSCTL